MDRISTPSKAVDLFGAGKHGFKDGNLGGGIAPTDLNAAWFNGSQEEILNVIEAAGIVPAAATRNQLLLALRAAGAFATPAQFDNTTKAATSAFVQRALGNFQDVVTLSATATLTAADFGKVILVDATAGSVTLTLPAAPVTRGCGMRIYRADGVAANTVTVQRQGSDLINGVNNFSAGASSTSVILRRAGDYIELVSNSASYTALSGGGAASLGVSGFQKSPSGLMEQWGSIVSGASTYALTFPIAFPNACIGVWPVPIIANNQTYDINVANITLSGASLFPNTGNAGTTLSMSWRALGY